MYRIITKREIASNIISLKVSAPLIAKKVKPGQFIILLADEKGERIPVTIADYNRENGWIRIVFQVVGKTTAQLSQMNEGDELFALVGPLGNPSKIEKYGTVVTVGGGTGIACIYPITRELKKAGNRVISIIGAKTRDLIIMEDEMRKASTELLVTTDDGSYARKGFVTEILDEVLRTEKDVKKVWAIGPAPMMKAACEVTKPYGIETIVSLNAIMVDGTGMCGSCRVTVNGETKFVCVDGPEFNGHLVDWQEFMNRLARYGQLEKLCFEAYRNACREENG
ncbi:MAG: sulfide/dihydroorotate dehydrogenase-like FAD/NAD-binding protein [Candidatus Hadarchaeaceae archaeon]|nr:sulfide/dihydroorotate dehydrogenase-like FAD/NAD-binding protein [Hadesarchaea archaeon]MDH5685429.1 sulfide/dihydroorotate dehydrogenase-like FAD/NAD-binding protein [Hadesarchaea archaeon]